MIKLTKRIKPTFKPTIIILDNIYEVNLKELALVITCRFQTGIPWFRKIGDTGIIISYTGIETKKVFNDGTLFWYFTVLQVWYARVEKYHSLIVFDPIYNLCHYTDGIDQIKTYETTKTLPIDPTPDLVIDQIVKKIEQKFRRK